MAHVRVSTRASTGLALPPLRCRQRLTVLPVSVSLARVLAQDKNDVDEFSSVGGREKLQASIEKLGAKVIARLTNTVTHIIVSDEFEQAKFVKGDKAGEPKNGEWISEAPAKGSAEGCDVISEKDIKKVLH